MIKKFFCAVGAAYLIAMTVLQVWIMIAFPGWKNPEFIPWSSHQYIKLYVAFNSFFSAFALICAIVTIFAICKIFQTTKKLSQTNPQVKLNKTTFLIHSALLIL